MNDGNGGVNGLEANSIGREGEGARQSTSTVETQQCCVLLCCGLELTFEALLLARDSGEQQASLERISEGCRCSIRG